MARTSNPHAAAVKAWESRHRAMQAGGSDSHGSRGDYMAPLRGHEFDPKIHKDTESLYKRADGTWDPARAVLHEEIIRDRLEGVPGSADPTIYVLGGGPASGKTTAVKESGEVPNTDPSKGPRMAVLANPDNERQDLPEYERFVAEGDLNVGFYTHEEASHISKELSRRAVAKGVDLVLDTSGDNDVAKFHSKIADLKAKAVGKTPKVKGIYVTISLEEAWKRAVARALDPTSEDHGRIPRPRFFSKLHAGVSVGFEERAKVFDEIKLYDTSGPKGSRPKLLASGVGGKLTIHDPVGYAAFKAKAALSDSSGPKAAEERRRFSLWAWDYARTQGLDFGPMKEGD